MSVLTILLSVFLSFQNPKYVHAENQNYHIFLPLVLLNAANSATDNRNEDFVDLVRFVETVKTGEPDITGLYAAHRLAKRVVRQPSGNPDFISNDPHEITQYMLTSTEVVGLLAHRHLAGKLFSEINLGDILFAIHGDGQIEQYRVVEIRKYQVIGGESVKYRELDSNEILTAAQLFSYFYLGGPHMTLQTCIMRENNSSWGRLFIKALPVN